MSKESYANGATKGRDCPGKRHMLRFLNGERLTQAQAIAAYCYDCMGFYVDGKVDCGNALCPLHPLMPYNPSRQPAVERKQAGREAGSAEAA